MVLSNKIIVAGLVATLVSLNSCGDRAKAKVEGHVFYADGVEFGLTTDTTLNENGQYNIFNLEGYTKGSLSLEHMVYDYQNVLVGDTPCVGTTDDAYDENGFLVGSCTLGISSVDALRGLSAYEIAVKDGFVGSEEQWLQSLHGQNGANGKDGADGKDGQNNLSTVTALPVSNTYPNGAVEIKTGLDTNGNGVLDVKEITSSSIVLNGIDGTNGTNGTDGGLITPPEYICAAGDSDSKCGINQDIFKLDEIIFSEEDFATDPYNYGGTLYHDIIRGVTETIKWRVESTNGIVASDFSIDNQWTNGSFVSGTTPFSPIKGYKLYSIDGALTIEKDSGEKATIRIDETGKSTILNTGLTISNNKLEKKLCFTAEVTACVTYLPLWTAK